MGIVTDVLDDLQRYAAIRSGNPKSGQYFVDALNGEPLDPPAKLRMTEKDALAYVLECGGDGDSTFPDATPEEAGLAFLLIHLDETFATKVGPGTTVTVTAKRLVVTDPVGLERTEVDPDGEYYWTGDKPAEFEE